MLRLSGTPRVIIGERLAPSLPDKTYCLLALVILRFNGVADRGVLAALLWEDRPADAARANLRNLLLRLRAWEERNGVVLLHTDAARAWRSADCEPCDLEAIAASAPAATGAELERLGDLYGGDLLAGRGIDFASDLAHWLEEQSEMLAERCFDIIGEAAGEEILRRLAERLPLDERVERALLVHLSAAKSAEAVRAEYRRFAARLREEAGAEPEIETRLLAASLGVLFDRPDAMNTPSVKPKRAGLPRVLILPPMDEGSSKWARVATSLVDDVTFSLCRMRTFAVIAPHTARMISREPATTRLVPDIDYVLFTRLLPGMTDGEYRFGFSLARGGTGEILVGDQLRFSIDSLPSRHTDLTRLVARLVAGEIERSELGIYRLSNSPTAYVYYLLGQERLRMVDLPELRSARRAFQRALDLEPAFAPAMSMIARTLSLEWLVLNRGDDELLVQSRRMALQAVERDPLDPSGYRELGNASLYLQDLDASLEYLGEARNRAPHHADVLLDNADALAHNSRFKEAKRTIDEAMVLNPAAPDEYRWVAATIQFFLRDFRGALKLALSMDKPEPLGRLIAASAHLIGNHELARLWRDRVLERHPDFRVADWDRIVPMRNVADRQFFADAMRRAGFV